MRGFPLFIGGYLLQHVQQPSDGGCQRVCGLDEKLAVERPLLLHGAQSPLGLAERAFDLLQLLRKRFVGLLQLSFDLGVVLWREKDQR